MITIHFFKIVNKKRGGRKTVIYEFLGTGMISVMPVPLLSVFISIFGQAPYTLITAYIKLLKSGSALVIPFSMRVNPFRASSLSNVSQDTILHDVPATIIFPDS